MIELGLAVESLVPWFAHEQESPFVLIRGSDAHAAAWADMLAEALRRSYISDVTLNDRAASTGRQQSEIVAAKLPDRGATMAGDFGEFLVFLYHATQEHPVEVIGPKKWRLKQDRTKPAPYSDVVHFILPSWPTPTADDRLLCSEVKTKSTDGASTPVSAAIEDSKKDRVSRLAKTLVWLKERAIGEDLGSTKIEHLERFIDAVGSPPYQKEFRAVAIVCSSLVDNEIGDAPTVTPLDYSLVVMSVPKLKEIYQSVFDAALASTSA
jgi:hypothetical protein